MKKKTVRLNKYDRRLLSELVGFRVPERIISEGGDDFQGAKLVSKKSKTIRNTIKEDMDDK